MKIFCNIKFIIFIFALTACSSEFTQQKLITTTPVSESIEERESLFSEFILSTTDIQGILWPIVIDDENHDEVVAVIQTSKQVMQMKRDYSLMSFELKKQYQDNACDCAIYMICEDGEDDSRLQQCEKIESQKQANAELSARIVEQLQLMQEQIESAGGEWLVYDALSLNSSNQTLVLQDLPMNYEVYQREGYIYIEAKSEDLLLKLDIVEWPSYWDVVGEIIRDPDTNREQQGIINFQWPKRI